MQEEIKPILSNGKWFKNYNKYLKNTAQLGTYVLIFYQETEEIKMYTRTLHNLLDSD